MKPQGDDQLHIPIRRRLLTLLLFATLAACAAVPTPEVRVATDLSLSHFYKSPIGAYGLEPTEELLSLAGKRVRIIGYMVGEQDPLPAQFKLTSLPVKLAEREDGPADDLPAATVFVHLTGTNAQRVVKFNPERLSIIGILEVGYREEADGRVSHVRLMLDAESPNAHRRSPAQSG